MGKLLEKKPKLRPNLATMARHKFIQKNSALCNKLDHQVLIALERFGFQSSLKRQLAKIKMPRADEKKIKERFQHIDRDKSGALSLDELEQLLLDLGVAPDQTRQHAVELMRSVDTDGSGKVELVEFTQAWRGMMLQLNQRYARAVFDHLDDDGDGYITKDEFQRGLKMGLGEVAQMIQEIDLDGDGRVSFDEFQQAMADEVDSSDLLSPMIDLGGAVASKSIQDGWKHVFYGTDKGAALSVPI